MNLDERTFKFHQIFNPGLVGKISKIYLKNKKFVYYTSADTAMKIIRNREIWFRNTNTMNDFSEISYGIELIRSVMSGPEGERFRDAVESIFEGTIQKADELLAGWERDWRLETFISCVSRHKKSEDMRGRLSMWRAYGDIALVINNTPMTTNSDLLAVHSFPVLYLAEAGLSSYLSKITEAIQSEADYLQSLGQDTLVAYIRQMLFRFSIATKHPGFREEKEWRIYYRPSERKSPEMTKETLVLNGTPQTVHKLRLADKLDNGLHGADIPSLLNHIIIGPSEFPYVSYRAFVDILDEAGVEQVHSKVFVSDIPLRSR